MTDIEVIGPGFGRTGTMSLYTALKALGYKPHHMYEVLTKGREALVGWARLGRQLMTNSKPDMKLMAEVRRESLFSSV